MNKEEIDIWLKHFANKQTGYQIFDENGTRREINFFIVFLYLKGLQQKVNQLETNRDEAIEEIKDLLEHWRGNDLVERDLNILLSLLERGKE